MGTDKLDVVVEREDMQDDKETLSCMAFMVRKLDTVNSLYFSYLGWIDMAAIIVMLGALAELVLGVLSYKITIERFSFAEASFGIFMFLAQALQLRFVQREAARYGKFTAYLRLFIYSKIDPKAHYTDVLDTLKRKYLATHPETSTLSRDASFLCDATLAQVVDEYVPQWRLQQLQPQPPPPQQPQQQPLDRAAPHVLLGRLSQWAVRCGMAADRLRHCVWARPLQPLPRPLGSTYLDILEGYYANFARKVAAWLADQGFASKAGVDTTANTGAGASRLRLVLYVPSSRQDLEHYQEERVSQLLVEGERHGICAIDHAAVAAIHRIVFHWRHDTTEYFDLVRAANCLLLPRYEASLNFHLFVFKKSLEELAEKWCQQWQKAHPGWGCPITVSVQDFQPEFTNKWNSHAPSKATLVC